MNNHPQRRREAILRIVDGGAVHSQDELAERLSARGFQVAQPTLSRDVRELGLVKGAEGYARSGAVGKGSRAAELDRTLERLVLSAVATGNLVVLRTPPAAAQPVARAIDEAPPRDVIGTIAGDDTVFLATTSAAAAQRLAKKLVRS